MGGFSTSLSTYLHCVEQYDPVTMKWQYMPSYASLAMCLGDVAPESCVEVLERGPAACGSCKS